MTTYNNMIVSRGTKKVHRLDDGRLFAGCGVRAALIRYRRWLNGEIVERPSLVSLIDKQTDSVVVVIELDGTIVVHEEDGPQIVDDEFVAYGSGDEAAMAAMHMGATAVRAVEIAALIDPYTGGKIQSERLRKESDDGA